MNSYILLCMEHYFNCVYAFLLYPVILGYNILFDYRLLLLKMYLPSRQCECHYVPRRIKIDKGLRKFIHFDIP